MRSTGWAWRRATTMIALTPLLVVGGCADDEPTDVPTTPTTEASSTPTPSPTVDLTRLPEKPAAMAEPTTDGAIAAATYVMDLLAYTFASGDTGPWREITLESCGLCDGVAQDVTAMVDAGQTSSGYEITVSSPTAVEISHDEWFSVDMQVTQGPSQRYDASGEVVGTGTGGTYDAVFALAWADGWTVHEMGLEEVDAGSVGDG